MPGTSPSITNSKSLGNRPWELPGRYAPADAKPAAAMSAIWTSRRTIRDVAERNWEPIRFIAKTPLPKSTRFARALQKDGAGRRACRDGRGNSDILAGRWRAAAQLLPECPRRQWISPRGAPRLWPDQRADQWLLG